MSFVPDDFEPPLHFATRTFELEPLGPQHNDRDYAAWTSSIDHIRATPGFPDGNWPQEMTPAENRNDLERHANDFAQRKGFTYTVLQDGDVIGCVYIYPPRDGGEGAAVRSWVSADRAHFDETLRSALRKWLQDAWPFTRIEYAG